APFDSRKERQDYSQQAALNRSIPSARALAHQRRVRLQATPDRIFHANEDARWVPDSERGPRCLKDSYSRSVSCASSVRVGNHFQIKLAAPGAHRQDVGFSPSECRSQREYLAEYSPGPFVDFVPQEGTDVEARQPAMT